MTDAPERIWAYPHWIVGWDALVASKAPIIEPHGVSNKVLFIRADLAPQWQPIETAPREELEDLILFNGKVFVGGWWEGVWADSVSDYASPQPTHWMPLPQPPEE